MANYTSIAHLLGEGVQRNRKEHEPGTVVVGPVEITQHIDAKLNDPEVQSYVTIHQEYPEIGEDLEKEGVTTSETTKFVDTKTVPLEGVLKPRGPIKESRSWLSLFKRYLSRKKQPQETP